MLQLNIVCSDVERVVDLGVSDMLLKTQML